MIISLLLVNFDSEITESSMHEVIYDVNSLCNRPGYRILYRYDKTANNGGILVAVKEKI